MSNTDVFDSLLNQVGMIISGKSQDFSIFEMLGQSTRELTHSAFIAQMLNPQGEHGKGRIFLDLFIDTIKPKITSLDYDTQNVTVQIEKECGVKDGDGSTAKGGRIDIYIENYKGQIIVIENKIYAPDQKDQLQRYRNSTGKDSTILYLTLDGHTSTNTPPSVKYSTLSYEKDITAWLKRCLEASKDDYSLSNIINQYMATINKLTSDLKVIEKIQSSSSNIKAALQIARLADKARNEVKKQFLEDLAIHLNLKDKEVREEGKEWILQTEDCEWCIEHRFFVRFLNPETRLKIDCNWMYVEFPTSPYSNADKIDFHTFNFPASLWCDNKYEFWKILEPEINKIRKDYNLK